MYRVLTYTLGEGWNLHGAFATVTAANEAAFTASWVFRYVAVVWVRPSEHGEPRVVILRTNARHLTRMVNAANFRKVALCFEGCDDDVPHPGDTRP